VLGLQSRQEGKGIVTILCADDYGMTSGISEGILALCREGKLNATSVMTEAPLLPGYAKPLLELSNKVQIGLHFNLTMPFQGKPAYGRNYLMLRPRLSATERADVALRLRLQMQRFEEIFGRAPDFIDGHEHVHVMPSVRGIFLAEITKRFGTASHRRPWIRQVASPVLKTNTRFKAFVLNVLNLGFRSACKNRGFETNTAFRGVYSLTPGAPFEQLLNGWIDTGSGRTLIMCHPSAHVEAGDAISSARVREFKVLSDTADVRKAAAAE
jgi:chitin disaccharide deacetylase